MKNEHENYNTTPNSETPVRRSRFNFTNNRLETSSTPAHQHVQRPASPMNPNSRHLLHHDDKNGPLIFNVATLMREHEGAHREYDFEQDTLKIAQEEGEKPDVATNVVGHIKLTKIRRDILAQGYGEADVVLECVRCLNDFPTHVEFEIEEVFRPSIDIITGIQIKPENEDEEADLKIDANHLLNLGEAIRQQILVSLPIKPVCGDDCPGLLTDLERVNQTTSIPDDDIAGEQPAEEEADAAPVDPRWAALSQLLKNQDKE